ncbi:MAG: C_GCAxxG_C_C family protein [Oscillospiraceae bacterium]|nr:C_GCAxxG_C_C family protein [Oscillospiraceae bacterium]
MTKEEILDLCGKAAREAQIRDDNCARSTLIGLQKYFDFITDDVVRASFSLCGGAGAASGSCGTYTCGLLAVGLKYNSLPEEEQADPEKAKLAEGKFIAFRDKFISEMGTTLCPEFHKKVYGRSYIFTNPEDAKAYGELTEHRYKCADVVEKATRVCAEFLLED